MRSATLAEKDAKRALRVERTFAQRLLRRCIRLRSSTDLCARFNEYIPWQMLLLINLPSGRHWAATSPVGVEKKTRPRPRNLCIADSVSASTAGRLPYRRVNSMLSFASGVARLIPVSKPLWYNTYRRRCAIGAAPLWGVIRRRRPCLYVRYKVSLVNVSRGRLSRHGSRGALISSARVGVRVLRSVVSPIPVYDQPPILCARRRAAWRFRRI